MSSPSRFQAARRAAWQLVLAWTIAVAAVLLALAGVMRLSASHQLRDDARQSALNWAAYAAATVPDLEQALSGGGFTPEARDQLRRLRHASEVFRFKLFAPDGRQLFVSDDLDRAPAPPSAATAVSAPHSVPADVLLGGTHVELKRETRADRPAVYSEAYVPVRDQGRLLGVVEVYVDQARRAAAIQRAYLEVAAAAALLLTALMAAGGWLLWRRQRLHRDAEARARYLAKHDRLSGLMNRAHFQRVLQEKARRRRQDRRPLALLCIDLDHFQGVNDMHGHAVGDEILRQAAQRLRGVVREGDRIARLGGDEFAVLQAHVAHAGDVAGLGERIVDALAAPYEIDGRPVRCAASVGGVMLGRDAQDHQELLHKAGVAVYRAKSSGRQRFSFYDPQLDEELQVRRTLTDDLREAIRGDQLRMVFQPQFAADGRTLRGREALLRWQHPQRGNVGPAQFIPLAEAGGTIVALGDWVMQQACSAAAHWPAGESVAVNLSAAQFHDPEHLIVTVQQALESTGLAPERLELEITESLLLQDGDETLETLNRLAGLGVRVSLDDFGTGYSSLAYLTRFPIHKLKIDRAFTQRLGDDAKVDLIVRAIISLAHALRIEVNAEGVETPQQLAALQGYGCDELQGYLLGKPAPSSADPLRVREDRAERAAPAASASPASSSAWVAGSGTGAVGLLNVTR